jgi:hypothetical protein
MTFQGCFLLSFDSFGKVVSEKKIFILGRSSMKIGNLVPIHLQTWPPQAILVSDWLISKKSSSGFRGEDFLEINQSEKRIACGGHVC